MKKIFVAVLISIFVLLSFSSCTYLQLGKVYIQNLSGHDVKNVEIYWTTLQGEEKSISINKVEKASYSDYYGVLITDSGTYDSDGDYRVPFFINYEIGDEKYSVSSSKTSKVDKEGNYYDPKAVFIADETYCIKIYSEYYSIEED